MAVNTVEENVKRCGVKSNRTHMRDRRSQEEWNILGVLRKVTIMERTWRVADEMMNKATEIDTDVIE